MSGSVLGVVSLAVGVTPVGVVGVLVVALAVLEFVGIDPVAVAVPVAVVVLDAVALGIVVVAVFVTVLDPVVPGVVAVVLALGLPAVMPSFPDSLPSLESTQPVKAAKQMKAPRVLGDGCRPCMGIEYARALRS
jgi:hypothetical protein